MFSYIFYKQNSNFHKSSFLSQISIFVSFKNYINHLNQLIIQTISICSLKLSFILSSREKFFVCLFAFLHYNFFFVKQIYLNHFIELITPSLFCTGCWKNNNKCYENFISENEKQKLFLVLFFLQLHSSLWWLSHNRTTHA